MQASGWAALCAYMGAVWGRQVSEAERSAGWKLMGGLPDEAVENAVTLLAEEGRDRLPPMSVILKTSRDLTQALAASHTPALPASDVLTDQEHQAVLIGLRARETPEQRRRADRVVAGTRDLPMKVRLRLARELLMDAAKVDASTWDDLYETATSREFKHHPNLFRGVDIHA